MKNFADCLTKVLENKGITKKELAIMLGIADTNVVRWTTNKIVPRIDTVLKICQCLEMTPNELLGIEE